MVFKKYKLKDLGEIVTGKTPKKSNKEYYNSNDIMFIKPDDLFQDNILLLDKSKEYISKKGAETVRVLPKNSVLVTCIGTIGKVAILYSDKAAFNQQINAIIPNEKIIISKFLAYSIWFNRLKLQAIANAPIVPIINKTQFSEFEIQVPNIDYQKKVVNILDKASDLINKRKSQIEALDQLTQSVFLEMFGDPYKNPKNWPVGTIKDITLKTQYGTSKKASENKGKYPILRMGNITYNGFLDFNDMKYIDLDDSEAEKYLVHKGDLLFNRTNSKELVGKTAVYREELPMAYAGYLVKLVPNEKANSDFISGFLNSKYGKTLLYSMAKNIVGMANINAEELKRIKIYIPPRDLQDKFASIISNILERRELLNKGLKLLEENYNSLMQRAFKGELFTEEKVSNL
jgi:type I restriction enzyme, S subunit